MNSELVRRGIERAYAILDEALAAGLIPGAVALLGVDRGWLEPHVVGHAVDLPSERVPMRADTIFDLASLTKVVATLPVILLLVWEGVADLQAPAAEVFEEWAGDPHKGRITLLHLLTHTSGLPAHVKLYDHGWSPEEIIQQVLSTPLAHPPGVRVVYSDLGYILLGEWVRRVTGQDLATWTREHIYESLGMRDTMFLPPTELRDRIAACEYRDYLGGYQRGQVNDDNSWALGGVSGHAGLFSTAQDLAIYLDACWLSWAEEGFFPRPLVAAALRDYTAGLGGHRGLGWVLKGDPYDNSGQLTSPRAFGHTGYTGTSLWIDPEYRLKMILLTNRVHATLRPGIVSLRRRFHNAVVCALA